MAIFTEAEYSEIEKARARLEAWRKTFQPYPAYPEETEEPMPPREVIHRHSNMGRQEFDLLQQTALKADYLATKLLEREKKKDRGYRQYKVDKPTK